MYKIIKWHKDQEAPLVQVADVVRELTHGMIDIREVPDTGGVVNAVVVADHPLYPKLTQRLYDGPPRQ